MTAELTPDTAPVILMPGTVVQAAGYLGGYFAVVQDAEAEFGSDGGWPDTTRVVIIEPADGPWQNGDVVEVLTEALTVTEASQ